MSGSMHHLPPVAPGHVRFPLPFSGGMIQVEPPIWLVIAAVVLLLLALSCAAVLLEAFKEKRMNANRG